MNKKVLISIVVVIVVLLVGGVSYMMVANNSTNSAITNTTPITNTSVNTNTTANTSTTNTNTAVNANINTSAKATFESKKENGKMVLYKVMNGASTKTGLVVTITKAGTAEVLVNIVVSPDQTKAVYNQWDESGSGQDIYVSDTDGKNSKKLASQEVGDGNGSLNQSSLQWSSDGKYITYSEGVLTCDENCKSPADFTGMKVTYQVNVATGAKEELSRVPSGSL
jgi:ABC-type Na+ efflux pump permease subunit